MAMHYDAAPATIAAATGAAKAAAAALRKGASVTLRRLNRGKYRIGRSSQCNQEFFSIRWGNTHRDLFKMPKWLSSLYNKL